MLSYLLNNEKVYKVKVDYQYKQEFGFRTKKSGQRTQYSNRNFEDESWMLTGDLNIAEPGARAGFAGPNIIEQTVRQKLPSDFQKSEFLLEKGQIDMIIPRNELRQRLHKMLLILTHSVRTLRD